VELLRRGGFGAALLASIVLRGVSVGLLELHRHDARPWTGLEIDRVRTLTHQLGAALHAVAPAALAPAPR
jgi:GAF domain-containing protein